MFEECLKLITDLGRTCGTCPMRKSRTRLVTLDLTYISRRGLRFFNVTSRDLESFLKHYTLLALHFLRLTMDDKPEAALDIKLQYEESPRNLVQERYQELLQAQESEPDNVFLSGYSLRELDPNLVVLDEGATEHPRVRSSPSNVYPYKLLTLS